MTTEKGKTICPGCLRGFSAPDDVDVVSCPNCAATVVVSGESREVHVWGAKAEEVQRVARTLSDSDKTDHTTYENGVDHVKAFTARAKSHPLIAAVLLTSIVIGGVAQFTDAIEKITKFVASLTNENVSLTSLPGETGWIFAGYFDVESEAFTEGPYVSIVSSNTRGNRRYVELGDVIALRAARKVIIVDFSTKGQERNLESPIVTGAVGSDDETGLVLPKNTELVVRDVSEGRWPNAPNAALWLRVIEKPE